MLVADTAGYGKPLAPGTWSHARLSVTDCVRHTLTYDPDVALLGLSTPAEQDAAFAAAHGFAPLAPGELRALEARAASVIAGKGPTWWNPDD